MVVLIAGGCGEVGERIDLTVENQRADTEAKDMAMIWAMAVEPLQ